MSRIDISNYLVHFTKGQSAFDNFRSIINQKTLIGGTGFIKGKQECICFTEAPLHALQDILDQSDAHSFRYAPFGIIIKKDWLFKQGGRPVIYQTKEEGDKLPAELWWRHVTYDPIADNPVDFTWEREWRVKTDKLEICPDNAILVVPGVDELRGVCEAHDIADSIPDDLFDRLDDTIPLNATIDGENWTVILVRNPPNGWSGLDVDLE